MIFVSYKYNIPSLCKFKLLIKLFKNRGNYLKIVVILMCFYNIRIHIILI